MNGLSALAAALSPHLAGAGLCALRILPVALLSPFLGGPLVPGMVRICLAAGLGVAVHLMRGASPPPLEGLALLAAGAREVLLGGAMGVLASLPLEAARAGGRLADTLRGATLSELHVPIIRQRETALGDLLVQWTIVVAAWAGADRLVVTAVLETFATIPLGAWAPGDSLPGAALRAAAEVVSAALCLGAPAAGGVLAADLALALASRATPWLGVAGAVQPARAALGLLAVSVPAAALGGKLVSLVALSAGLVRHLSAGAAP